MTTVVGNGRVVTPAGVLAGGSVHLADGVVVAVEATTPTRCDLDASGGWIAPGFVDLQINGGPGLDLTTAPRRVDELAARLPGSGVTAFLPTIVTASPERRADALAAWAERRPVTPGAAVPLGLHLEGPLLASARRGAHPAEHLRAASPSVIAGWSRAAGVRLVTLAPELPGALDAIRGLVASGVVVALGHTDATAEQVDAALAAGATYVTHLFNALRPFHHRDPGAIGRVLGGGDVVAGLIADGHHVDPWAVRTAWRALGPHRLNLVTDAVAGAPGADGLVRTPAGVLAGSTLTLDAAVRNLVAWTGAAVADALATVTSTPAAVLGLADRGRLVPGARADVVVLDDHLRVRTTLVAAP